MELSPASPPMSLLAQSANGAQHGAKPRDKRFIVRLRRRPASAPGALTHELIPTPTAPCDAAPPAHALFDAGRSHPLSSSLSTDNDSQRSQASGSDSCGSVLGKRASLGDELSAPLRKRSCLRACAPGTHLKLDAGGAPLRVRFCADLVTVRTLAPDHKREASRLSWYSEPGWDPSHASREIEDDSSDESDELDPPADAELSQTEADMLAADLEYEVRREAAAAAYAAQHAHSDDDEDAAGGGYSESEDDDGETSSGLASATDGDSSSDDAEMQVAEGGGCEAPLFSTLYSPPAKSLPLRCDAELVPLSLPHAHSDAAATEAACCEIRAACDTRSVCTAEDAVCVTDVSCVTDAACLVHIDMMTTEAFVEWATCTMDGSSGATSQTDVQSGLPPLSECCAATAQGEVSAPRADLPPCCPP